MGLFLDSNYFCALYNPDDSLFPQAQRVARAIERNRPNLFISNLIFLEIVTVVSQRVGRIEAIRLGNHLKEGPVRTIHIDQDLNQQAWGLFKEIRKLEKRISVLLTVAF